MYDNKIFESSEDFNSQKQYASNFIHALVSTFLDYWNVFVFLTQLHKSAEIRCHFLQQACLN